MHDRKPLSFCLLTTGLFLAALSMTVCAAPSAWAAGKDVGSFRAELPAGWRLSQEADMATISAPDGVCRIFVLEKRYDDGDLKSLARERAAVFGAKDVRSPGAGPGLVSEGKAERHWFIMVDGQYVEISATAGCREAGPVLMSFRPAPAAAKGLAQIVASLQTPQVLDWLTFQATVPLAAGDVAAPGKSGMPDFARYGGPPAPGEKTVGVTADLPQGWTRTVAGAWTVFASPDGGDWLAARVYPLESDDYKAFLAAAKERARNLGGRNITTGEGMVEFRTPEGNIGNMALYGKRCLLTLVSGDGEELADVMASVSPEGN